MNTDGIKQMTFDSQQAQACLDENRHEEAVKMAEAWLADSPGDVEAIIILSQGLLRLGKLDRLQGLLREVDERIGGLSRVYLRLGELCGKSGLNAESLNFFHKYNTLSASISSEENGRLLETPAEVTDDEGESEEETGDISHEFYTVTLADLYISQGHLSLAREVLTAVLAKEPKNDQALTKLAELDKMMTAGGVLSESAVADADVIETNAAIVFELEGWLARIGRIRSPSV
jgi:predicted Zn-dependent protease